MFELHTSFDLLASLSHFIYSYRQSLGTPDSTVISPRIINQEKGGAILFVWNDVDREKSSSHVTNFGIFDPETQKHQIIYTYEKKVKVVSCSVNEERTLLGFSIVKPRESTSDKKHKEVYQAYLAELQSVEKIVYSLNMERSTFLKVQFLYPDQQRQSRSRDSNMLVFLHKESIGLYKVQMGRIGDRGIMMSGQPKTEQIVRKFVWCQWDTQQQRLHYIKNARLESGGENVSQKISTIQFFDKGRYEEMIEVPLNFPFPHIRTADKSHYGDIPLYPGIPELTLNVAVLTQASGAFCVCYHKQIKEPKSKASAGLQVKSDLRSIMHLGMKTVIPSHENLCEFQSPSDCQDVEYYISMVHHAKTLYGCVSNLPRSVVIQKRLVFSWLGSYLVVMLPGYFVHLLNVGPSFEPCHHILLHDYRNVAQFSQDSSFTRSTSVKFTLEGDDSEHVMSLRDLSSSTSLSKASFERSQSSMSSTSAPIIPVFSEHCAAMKTLLPCQSFVRESGSTAQHLYDYRSGCLLKLVLNVDLMVENFRDAYWQTRLAILHYLILHQRDFSAIKKMFQVLCENPTNSEVNSMFTEYLVASTFAEMKKQVDREVLNLLSFTFTQTLRGQFEKSPSGERMAHISYSSLEVVDLNKRSFRESKSRPNEEFWDTLNKRLRMRHSQVAPRFSHDTVMRMYRQADSEEASGKPVWDAMHVNDSFFDGLYTLKLKEVAPGIRRSLGSESSSASKQSGRSSRLDSVLGSTPMFLQTREIQESNLFKRQLSVLTEDLLIKHLSSYLPKESRSKAKNVAREYLYCQAKVSWQLCHLIWSLHGQSMAHQLEDCLLPDLREPSTDEEYELFQLYERFYLTVGDLGFPLPPGFNSFFTAVGFKCLELHLFFQYVDNHILSLTPDFILQLLEDLPDEADEEVPQIKFQVISRLSKPFAEECFERWNHPITQQRKAREQTAQILLEGYLTQASSPQQGMGPGQGRRSRESSGRLSSSPTADKVTFRPLDTFMSHLESTVSGMSTSRSISYDPSLIESTSLYNTKTKTPFDLSTVNF